MNKLNLKKATKDWKVRLAQSQKHDLTENIKYTPLNAVIVITLPCVFSLSF